MDTLTRRRFLVASGVAGGGALLAGSTAITLHGLARHAGTAPVVASGATTLVVLTLYGGNDGLNTVIPYADDAYHSLRPDLAYDPADVLHLDGELGLNPAMGGLKEIWDARQLAIVRGVGYPNPDLSHFSSMDKWQTASPETPVSTGWIGRWLDGTGDDPVRAVNIGDVLPPLAVGARTAAATLPTGTYVPLSAGDAQAVTAFGVPDPHDTPALAMVTSALRSERQAASTFTAALNTTSSDPGDVDSPGGSAGGNQNLKQQLEVVGTCIKAGVPTRVYSVSLGGFDTHADEKSTQQTQLGVLDAALAGFLKEMAGDPHGRGVVVLVYSEFGRRVAANSSDGTDHGTAGPLFVAGVPVKGGMYGEQPSLTDLDQGDLKASVDFRTVYAELVDRVLGADPGPIVSPPADALGFLA